MASGHGGMGRGSSAWSSTANTRDDRWSENPSTKTDAWRQRRIERFYSINNGKTKLTIMQGDITRVQVDAIVNAANEHMTGGSGVDGVIHRAAGSQLREECIRHRQVEPGVRLPTGRSRILLSYNLAPNVSYIINTAGPVYSYYDKEKCAEELKSCYKTALALANLYDLTSIAFPAISCGIFGYPADDGAEAALEMSNKHADQLGEVKFVLFDDHIYDAWVKKASDLKFLAFQAETKRSIVKQESNDKNDADDDQDVISQPEPSTSPPGKGSFSSLVVKDVSSTGSDSQPSDSQATVEMTEPESQSSGIESQKTVEMADAQSDTPTTGDDPPRPVEASPSQHPEAKAALPTETSSATNIESSSL